MTSARHQAPPRVPVVLPLMEARLDSSGLMQVTIDHEPYVPVAHARLGRDALRSIVDDITRELGPVRVEVTGSDGTVFTDIATAPSSSVDGPEPAGASPMVLSGEVAGAGFLSEEEVAVAVIVAQLPAGADGTARLRLPPAVLGGRLGRVVLLGRTSGTLAWGDEVGDGGGGAA
jgi:hypothetical protein